MGNHPTVLKYLIRLLKSDSVNLNDKLKIVDSVLALQTYDEKTVVDFLFSAATNLKRLSVSKYYDISDDENSDEDLNSLQIPDQISNPAIQNTL